MDRRVDRAIEDVHEEDDEHERLDRGEHSSSGLRGPPAGGGSTPSSCPSAASGRPRGMSSGGAGAGRASAIAVAVQSRRPALACSLSSAAWPVRAKNTSSSVDCRAATSSTRCRPHRAGEPPRGRCPRVRRRHHDDPLVDGRARRRAPVRALSPSGIADSAKVSSMRSPPTCSLSSCGVPGAMTEPWSMTTTSSASRSASSRYWVVSRVVVPPGTSSSMRSHTPSRLRGSRPVVGSSRKSTDGRAMRLMAMSSRRRMPPE